MMLESTAQYSRSTLRLDNCCLFLVDYWGLCRRLFRSLVDSWLNIDLIEIDLRYILQPSLLECRIDLFCRRWYLFCVIWIKVLLVNPNTDSILCSSLLLLDLLGDGIVLKKRLITKLLLLHSWRRYVAHQYLFINSRIFLNWRWSSQLLRGICSLEWKGSGIAGKSTAAVHI